MNMFSIKRKIARIIDDNCPPPESVTDYKSVMPPHLVSVIENIGATLSGSRSFAGRYHEQVVIDKLSHDTSFPFDPNPHPHIKSLLDKSMTADWDFVVQHSAEVETILKEAGYGIYSAPPEYMDVNTVKMSRADFSDDNGNTVKVDIIMKRDLDKYMQLMNSMSVLSYAVYIWKHSPLYDGNLMQARNHVQSLVNTMYDVMDGTTNADR